VESTGSWVTGYFSVKGDKYVEKDEKYDKKMLKKDERATKTAGIATALKKAQKEEGYSKKPKAKKVVKGKGFIK